MRKNISIGGKPLIGEDFARIDQRFHSVMWGWRVEYPYYNNGEYKGDVVIPGTWGGELYPFQYSEIYKTDDSPNNPGIEESNLHLHLGLGWPGSDFEVVIVLAIRGDDYLQSFPPITAEIHKFGGADMKVYRYGRFITDFTQYGLWNRFFKMEKAMHIEVLTS